MTTRSSLTFWASHAGDDETSSTFTCSSLCTFWDADEYDEHNMWSPMLGLFCHVQVGVVMDSYFDEVVMGSIALSCHFALDFLCDKAELYYSPFLRLAIAAALPIGDRPP